MIGKSVDLKNKPILIVGGGISGLLTAHYALKYTNSKIYLFEASNRLGGKIRTFNTPFGPSEASAHSLLGSLPVLSLFKELNLDVLELNPGAKSRFIVRNLKLRRMPLRFFELLAIFFRAYFKLAPKNILPEDLSLEQWGNHFFGKKFTQYLLGPMLLGIYGCRPSELTVGMAFPKLAVKKGHSFLSFIIFNWRNRSPKKTKQPRSKMISIKNGLESIGEAIVLNLKQSNRVHLYLNSKIENQTELANVFEAKTQTPFKSNDFNIFFCIPTYALAKWVSATPTVEALVQVPYTSLLSVTLFVKRTCFQNKDGNSKFKPGVGFLIPESENRKILGVLQNSTCFENRSYSPKSIVSLTCILGGTILPNILELSERDIIQLITSELTDLLGFNGTFEHWVIHRWPSAIPQYGAKLNFALKALEEEWSSSPGKLFFGNAAGNISLRGMIEDAEQLFQSSLNEPAHQ